VPRFASFIVRRTLGAVVLVMVVASAALVLARLAPGDHLSTFGLDPAAVAAERRRLCLDCPVYQQYFGWVRGLARLDLGESTKYPGRPVSALIADRARNSFLTGAAALLLATLLGIPAGILTGSRRQGFLFHCTGAVSLILFAIPPIVLSLALLFLASRTGWFPVGGLPGDRGLLETTRYFVLPVLALALPMAAVLERLQSRSLRDALADPSILAARARGLSRARLVLRHAFRLSLKPVLAIYGVVVGSLISGSFVVEYVMTWPGLGMLMYDALVFRDANLVAGCAATGAAFLALGILLSDIALAAADPRLGESS
jgi:ABC-type dipeptide/oligopeptide/nickel transport system permease component